MGPTERGLTTILDAMHELGYNPKAGNPVPIEKIYQCNTISYEQYQAILREQADERRAYAQNRTAEEVGEESVRLAERMTKAGFPERFTSCSVDLTNIDSLLSGRWLYVCGNDVCDVTQKASACAKGWMSRREFGVVTFARSTTMVAELNDFDTSGEALSRYAAVDLLVISGFGAEPAREWATARMSELLGIRFGRPLPTIITSRYMPADLGTHLSESGNGMAAMDLMDMLMKQSLLVQV